MNKKRFTNIILIVVIVLIVSVAGYFASKKKPAPVAKQTPTPAQTNSYTSPAQKDETASWKTYSNSKYGFVLKYPTNWFTKEQSDKLIGLCPIQGGLPCKTDIDGFAADISITIKDNPKQLGLREYLESQGYDLTLKGIGTPSDIIVDGHEALRFGAEGLALATIDIKNKDQVIVLQALSSQKDTKVFDNVIATFKFTK